MKTNSPKAKALRDAWHTTAALDAVARSHDVSESTLKKFWWQEKLAGRLPAGRRKVEKPVAPVVPVVVADDDDDADDGIFGMPQMRIPAGDPLLAALQAHHGVSRIDLPPLGWLRTYPRRNNYAEAGLGSSIQQCEAEPSPHQLRYMRLRADFVFHSRDKRAAA